METSEVSLHEVKIWKALTERPKDWLTNKEIADRSKIKPRTVRAHTLKLVAFGLLEQAEVFPSHRFRIAATETARRHPHLKALEQAAKIFGV